MVELTYQAKPRWRKTETLTRDGGHVGVIVVALQPTALLLRIKGTRRVLSLPYSSAYTRAAILAADQVRTEKKLRRKGGRR
jgi:uncharacterized protein YqjF (DUF2071 family)